MQERNISEKEVRETILQPTKWHYGKYGELIAIRKYGRAEIKVAYLSLPDAIKVITVMRN